MNTTNTITLTDAERAAALERLETQYAFDEITLEQFWEQQARLTVPAFGDFIPATPPPPPPPPSEYELTVARLEAEANKNEAKWQEYYRDLVERLKAPLPKTDPYLNPTVHHLAEMDDKLRALELAKALRADGTIDAEDYDAFLNLGLST